VRRVVYLLGEPLVLTLLSSVNAQSRSSGVWWELLGTYDAVLPTP
jgi:hypothetical protein